MSSSALPVSSSSSVGDSVQAALQQYPTETRAELAVEQEAHDSVDEDEELAAAMLAVATGDYHSHSAVNSRSGEGRPWM